jgi:deoxyribonuclease-4
MMRRFDRLVGVDRIKAFHLNDTPSPLGSGRDRHANIGKGEIGAGPFRFFVEDRRFSDCPMILETPGGFDNYEEDLKTLRKNYQKGGFKWNFLHLKK